MFFKRKEKIKKQASKIDKLVTGLIIWGAVASMVGLSKKTRREKITENIKTEWTKIVKKWTEIAQDWYSLFWKTVVCILKIFNKKKDDKK